MSSGLQEYTDNVSRALLSYRKHGFEDPLGAPQFWFIAYALAQFLEDAQELPVFEGGTPWGTPGVGLRANQDFSGQKHNIFGLKAVYLISDDKALTSEDARSLASLLEMCADRAWRKVKLPLFNYKLKVRKHAGLELRLEEPNHKSLPHGNQLDATIRLFFDTKREMKIEVSWSARVL